MGRMQSADASTPSLARGPRNSCNEIVIDLRGPVGMDDIVPGRALPTPCTFVHSHICLYIAWLGRRGAVAAANLMPYLSAINRFLHDHARPSVALGSLVT